MKGVDADATLYVNIQGSEGRKSMEKGIKVEITIGRGTYTDIGPIIFWVFFVILAITCVLLVAVAIVLLIVVIKKLKN